MNISRRFVFPVAFLFTVLLFCITARTASAQSTATIHGTVTDPTGAVIANATIQIKASNGTISASTKSSDDGTYSVAVLSGEYRIEISSADFAPSENKVALANGATQTLDVRLELAATSANVIVSAEAQPQLATDVIAPVNVITAADIQRQQQRFLAPLLATAPGIALSQLGPEGGIESLFLDGGNSNYTRVMIDGVPEDVSLPGISIDVSNYTTDSIDKIEIVHGAASALYGSDAMTGVVDILTHRGTTTMPQLVLQSDGGTFGTAEGSGQLSGVIRRFDYSAESSYFTTRGQSPGAATFANDGPDTYPYFRDTTMAGNFGLRFSDTDTLRLTLRNNSSDAGQPGQTLFASDTELFPVSPGEHSVTHDFSSGLAWDFASGTHWQTHIQGFDSRYFEFFDIPNVFSATNKFNRAGLDARTSYLFNGGAVTAGYFFENETGGASGRHDNAGYLEIRYQLMRRLTALAGGRVEANDTFGTRFVPRVGASYAAHYGNDLIGDTRLRTSFGQGIKEPPLLPAGCAPNLKPEQATTFDAGIDQIFASNRVEVSATYFHNDFRDIVSFEFGNDPKTGGQNCLDFGGNYFNTDKARSYGADSSINVKAARWLSIGGTYSYDDTRVLSSPNAHDQALVPGNRLLKRPLNSANLFWDAHVRGVNWNVTGYFVGVRTDSDFLGLGITRNPGYVRWDTSAEVPLCSGLSFTAHIQNLLDKHYQDAVGYPALGYNYRLGIRYVWGGER